ncbi:MAG: CDP-alcohol phosphatidyltransferase family protein [Pseudomonadota bacterium]
MSGADVSRAQLERSSPLLQTELREWWVMRVMKWVEDFSIRVGLTPNAITVLATAFSCVCGVLYATGHILSAGWVVLFAGSLDFLDGRVARRTNQVTTQGAFFDSVADRYQDFIILFGLCVFYRNSVMLYIVLAALGGSVLVSYVRARAENLGVDLSSIGSMQRPERIFLIGFGSMISSALQVSLMPFWGQGNRPPQHLLILVLAFLAASTNWTAVRRIRHTMRVLAEKGTRE